MALAKKCDRCGIFYEPKKLQFKGGGAVNGIILMQREPDNSSFSRRGSYDLCPECLKDLYIWLYGEEKSDD